MGFRLGLQPLWARFAETFGEDPLVAATMGSSIIRGMQFVPNDGGNPRQAAACMKHFIAYSIPVDGHDRSPIQLPDRILKQLYVPSFQAAVDAGVLTAMESYNEVGGIPMVSSPDYLINLLRKQMNFTGFMVTDYQEIENLHNWHMVSSSQLEAVQLAMDDTTIDMSMVPLDTSFYDYMLSLVENGKVNISRVDDSVRRILNIKNTLGLLDNPTISVTDPLTSTVGQNQDWEVSLNAARESITLVTNIDNFLPLNPATVGNIFLTGPTCNSAISQSGGWSIHWQGVYYNWEFGRKVTVYDAMETQFPGDLEFYAGPAYNATNLSGVNMTLAMQYAKEADVIVACLGEGAYAEKPGDINDLMLPAGQLEYIEELATLGKPIVLIMIEGRPRLIPSAVAVAKSVILAYQPGPIGGQAIVEVLFGTTVPSGRLPFTYPYYQATVMYPYHHKWSDQCVISKGYHSTAYEFCNVQWEFGTGLSYTTFAYSNLVVSATEMNENQELSVQVTVKNTGTVAAKHSVLLFLYDMYRRVTPEYKLLKKFQKIHLAPQEQQTVSFSISSNDLQYVGMEGYYELEAGTFQIGISPYADCRNNSGFAIHTQDTTSNGAAMCQPFNLTLTSSYNAVCDRGCSMWSEGVCGVKMSNSQCVETCMAQQWNWDYVTCIMNYYQGSPVSFST
jgi:beta-glucosidase